MTSCSDGLVWVEHDSDGGSHGSGGDVLGESNSDGSGVSVGLDNLTPAASESSVIDGVLDLIDIGNSLSEIPGGSLLVVAVLESHESLVFSLGLDSSSESGEDSLDVQSNWLGFLELLLLLGTNFLYHSCVSY